MEETISFEDLGLDQASLDAVSAKGFTAPSPIQVLAIPRLLTGDANVIAKARTGTGKTAAFGIPLAQTIRQKSEEVRALVLTPTRELALQVSKEIESLSSSKYPRIASVYGGQSMSEQLRKLKNGVEIVVGTPGRVQDHLKRGSLKLDKIDYFILDEADEMLDMGFIEDIEAIFAQANPQSRVLLFSATMPPAILKIASQFMGEYEIVEEETPKEEPVLTKQYYWLVRENEKINALVRLIDSADDFYALVFTQTKSDADMVAKELDDRGYEAAALHGDIPQGQREKILNRFRCKKTQVLVATDVAARGIDIEGVTHVVNYAMPFDGPTYIHRIGRTGRAGAKGLAFTFVRPEERRKLGYLKNVSSGNLKEGKIPTVDEVLATKRSKLTKELESLLFLRDDEEALTNVANLGTDNVSACLASFDAEQNLDANSASKDAFVSNNVTEPATYQLVKADATFVELANTLCAKAQDASTVDVLASVLAQHFGKALEPKRYGTITPINANSANVRAIRLYVGMGRKDNMTRKDVALFFSDLLHIPNRLVDKIELTENFCLVSLPPDAAMRALDLCKKDRNLPHMHIDVKSDNFAVGKNFGKATNKGGFGKKFKDKTFSQDKYYGRQNFRKDKNSAHNAPRTDDKGAKPLMPMQYRTSNASLYKKGDKN